MLLNPDKGAAKRESALASPASYIEFRVNVAAGVPYRLWLRSRATGNSYNNDSLYVQFSGAVNATGAAVARIGTTSALAIVLEDHRDAWVANWGWSDAGYGADAPPVYFAQTGPQTIRLQQREDGIGWDQLILSSASLPVIARGDQERHDDGRREPGHIDRCQRGPPIRGSRNVSDFAHRDRRRRRERGQRDDDCREIRAFGRLPPLRHPRVLPTSWASGRSRRSRSDQRPPGRRRPRARQTG